MHRRRVVHERELHEVTLLDHQHRHVGIDAAVERPLHPRVAVQESGLASDRQREAAVERARRVERRRGRRPVIEWVELRARVVDRRLSAPVGAQYQRCLCPVHPERDRRGRHRELDVVATAGSDRQRRVVGDRARLVEVGPVDRDDPERRSGEDEGLGRVVGVDEAEAHGRSGGDRLVRDAVASGERLESVQLVGDHREVADLRGRRDARLDHECAE